MPRYERSTFGCWSCRLRKKKCDETLPTCTACDVRGITCHGYGPKPEWMDGGDKEKVVTEDFKRRIKENRKLQRDNSRQLLSEAAISPREVDVSDSLTLPSSSISAHTLETASLPSPSSPPPNNFRFSPYCPLVTTGADSLPSPPQYESGNAISRRGFEKEFETTLLMNYLDNVFPVQFNCYTPPATELGRGWLLALLTRTKPLYHAALALSAYYMHSILRVTEPARQICILNHWEEMKRQHALAFKELQVQIARLSDGDGTLSCTIETVAGILQLIFFELLRGGTDSWQIHLSAAASLVPPLAAHLTSSDFVPCHPLPPVGHHVCPGELAAKDPPLLHMPTPPANTSGIEKRPSHDAVACNFLVGTVIWFNIICSASTDSQRHLLDDISYLSSHNIQLDKIMGCENWVMILIFRISSLSAWKSTQQKEGCLSLRDLAARGADIERELNEGLVMNEEKIGQPIFKPASSLCQRLGVPQSKTNFVLTRIFACAALTYLHTTISGPHPNLPEIKDSVEKSFAAFHLLPTPVLLRNLVWPFTVTGCLAGKEREQFFEMAMETVKTEGEGCPGNLWKAWDVVQECWRLREAQEDSSKGVDWVNAMDSLGYRVLLV